MKRELLEAVIPNASIYALQFDDSVDRVFQTAPRAVEVDQLRPQSVSSSHLYSITG